MADPITKACRFIVKRGQASKAADAIRPPIGGHGGQRPGAGRPAKSEGEPAKKSDLRSIRIPDDEWDGIKTAAANMKLSASEFIRRAACEFGCIPNGKEVI